jgi:hypothetical protein
MKIRLPSKKTLAVAGIATYFTLQSLMGIGQYKHLSDLERNQGEAIAIRRAKELSDKLVVPIADTIFMFGPGIATDIYLTQKNIYDSK